MKTDGDKGTETFNIEEKKDLTIFQKLAAPGHSQIM